MKKILLSIVFTAALASLYSFTPIKKATAAVRNSTTKFSPRRKKSVVT